MFIWLRVSEWDGPRRVSHADGWDTTRWHRLFVGRAYSVTVLEAKGEKLGRKPRHEFSQLRN